MGDTRTVECGLQEMTSGDGGRTRLSAQAQGPHVVVLFIFVVLLSSCAGEEIRLPTPPPTLQKSATAAPTCNAQSLRDARKMLLPDAERLRGKSLTICEADWGTDGSRTYHLGTVEPGMTGPNLPSLIAFEGGAVPSACDVSLSSRLLVMVRGEWLEGQHIGCGVGA